MAIHYDFYSTKGLKNAKETVHVRTISHQTTTTDELIQRIVKSTTATTGDMRLLISALSEAVVNELLSGNRVHVDGLGYFSVSIDGDIKRNKNGKPILQNAAVRNVMFHPERKLMNELLDAHFTSADHRGRQSREAAEGSIEEALAELGRDGGVFTSAQFRKRLGLTASTAQRILLRLREEGRLENVGTRNSLLLRLKK